MNLVRTENILPRQCKRVEVGNILPKPKLRLVPPLEDSVHQKESHRNSQKPVKVRVWFDAHSPLRQFWYGKRGRCWSKADQATEGMKWNYYMAHRKTTPLFGMWDSEHVGRFVNDTIKKMEDACKESENHNAAALEHKLDQIWTHAMATLAHHTESDVEITFAIHAHSGVHQLDESTEHHQMGVVLQFDRHNHVDNEEDEVQDSGHGIHHSAHGHHQDRAHDVGYNHTEHHTHKGHSQHEHDYHGEHEGVVFESDAHLHPGHSRLVGGFWGSGHAHHDNHTGSHGDHSTHDHTEHGVHHAHHEGHHENSEHGQHQDRIHEGDHHGEHGSYHHNGHHAHGEHHNGHAVHLAHGEHEGVVFESDAHLHPGHTRLVGGFWGSGHHGHAHNDNGHTGTGIHDEIGHDVHQTEPHLTIHHPLHEGPMDEHSGSHQTDHASQLHEAVHENEMAHILGNHARKVAQLKVANASAEPE